MRKFLVIQTAYLGDVILATPIFSELRRIYPEAQIDVVVRKGNEQLISNDPNIHTIYCWDKTKNKYRSLLQLRKKIRAQQYNEVINLQRFHSAALLCWSAKSSSKVGFTKNVFPFIYTKKVEHTMTEGIHEVSRNLLTIAHHNAKKLIRPQLFPSSEDFKKVANYKNNKYYCLAPASVWFTKQLPLEKWVELIHELENDHTIYFLGSPADRALCEKIISNCKSHHKSLINLAGDLSLMESAALMKDAVMNFVNDSGPQHIASAMNAPVRTFFCSTVSDFGFGPLSDNAKIIETKTKLDCRPCGLHGKTSCPLGHFKCATTISIDDALN